MQERPMAQRTERITDGGRKLIIVDVPERNGGPRMLPETSREVVLTSTGKPIILRRPREEITLFES